MYTGVKKIKNEYKIISNLNHSAAKMMDLAQELY